MLWSHGLHRPEQHNCLRAVSGNLQCEKAEAVLYGATSAVHVAEQHGCQVTQAALCWVLAYAAVLHMQQVAELITEQESMLKYHKA